jgi:hypothetical protein
MSPLSDLASVWRRAQRPLLVILAMLLVAVSSIALGGWQQARHEKAALSNATSEISQMTGPAANGLRVQITACVDDLRPSSRTAWTCALAQPAVLESGSHAVPLLSSSSAVCQRISGWASMDRKVHADCLNQDLSSTPITINPAACDQGSGYAWGATFTEMYVPGQQSEPIQQHELTLHCAPEPSR